MAIIDRIEDGVMVLHTHTDPPREIHLPRDLFYRFDEGDVVRVVVEMDEKGGEEMKKEIEEMRERLKWVEL